MYENWNRIDMLEVVELYASDNNMIDSEEALSERFDNEIDIRDFIDERGEFDEIMFNESFSNWMDVLSKNGDIHEEQYANYCYVGNHCRLMTD